MEVTHLEQDFSHYWKYSLLGEFFWKEQEKLNERVEAWIRADRGLTPHKRFPFNLSEDQTPRPQRSTSPRKRRRFSTSDAWSLDTLPTTTSSGVTSALLHIDTDQVSAWHPRFPGKIIRKAGSVLRKPFEMAKTKKDSMHSIVGTSARKDLGSLGNPWLGFRGGVSWNRLPRDMESLWIDLFRPAGNGEIQMLDVDQMAPLCEFRNLRVLKITGMMQSYQRYIWKAVWLNPCLEELELGMALSPSIRSDTQTWTEWPVIRGGWTVGSHPQDPVYYGDLGDGNLHPGIGVGEYLDKHAIEKAKVLAGVVDRTFNRFSIKKLTLSGFVVNADPFIQWFDHRRLRNIHFKDDCIDAGFYLPRSLKGVNITSPDEERAFPMRRIELKGLKVVQLKGGKKIAEVPYRGRQTVQMRPELVSTIKSIEDVRIEVIESQARVEKPINGPGVKRLHRKPVPQPAVEPVKADSASC